MPGRFLYEADLKKMYADLCVEHKELVMKVMDLTYDVEHAITKDDKDKYREQLRSAQVDLDSYNSSDIITIKRLLSTGIPGGALINSDDFEDYVRDMAEENGDVNPGAHYLVIDWKTTAEGVSQDYTSVEVDGEMWWYR